jgi:hypothetical protein
MSSRVKPEKANRQCWECLKRRLVCDCTLPHCKKCSKNGKECPGYADQKPLQWIEPGKVTSRTRRKNTKGVSPQCTVPETSSYLAFADEADEAGLGTNDFLQWYSGELSDMYDPEQSAETQEMLHKAFNIDRARVEKVVSQRLTNEAKAMLQVSKNPLESLERILRVMTLEDLPSYELTSETCEVVQAVQYCG